VRDSLYLKLCHFGCCRQDFMQITKYVVTVKWTFNLLDPIQHCWVVYFLSTTYLKLLTFLEPRSFFGAANIMHWKSIMGTVFDTIFRRAKDWFETFIQKCLNLMENLWRIEKGDYSYTSWWESRISQIIFMWICMYYCNIVFAKTKNIYLTGA
jgi:hypothetical protein